MTIRYEANPPKIVPGTDMTLAVSSFADKIKSIYGICDAVHLTENVLGFERVSPIEASRQIKDTIPGMPITASMRVRDKTEVQIQEFVDRCIGMGLDGILVLMGDPAQNGMADSGQIPSTVVKRLHDNGTDSKIDLYLSVPNNPAFERLQKKIDAKPKGFITQVVQSSAQVQNLQDHLEEFAVIPIVLFPSEKNTRSAKFLEIDMSLYAEDFAGFASRVHSITGDVLITSPNDFFGLQRFLTAYAGMGHALK